jgi:hypothetical protein
MNYDAFKQLERILAKIEDDDLPFTLSDWSETPTSTSGRLWWKKTEACPTQYCLMGWAGQDPWFIERGFQVRGAYGNDRTVVFEEKTDWDAVTAFLGISQGEALFLLDQGNYGRDATPIEVSLRLRAFVRNKLSERSVALEIV